MEKLYCSGTSLKSLKLKGCTVLLNLECVENPKLQSLDITGCSSLLQAVKEPDNHEAGEESAIFTKSNIDQVINRKARLHFPVSCTLTANGAVLYAQSKSVAGCTITAGSVVYTGKALKPIPKVKYNGTALKKGVDFKVVSYKNNKKVGYGTVTIKGMGAYEGEAQGTFKILPKATRIKSVTGGKGKLTAKWTKVPGVAGYQIQISLKKNFSSGMKKMLNGASTIKKTLSKLKTKGIYYVRVRAYHKIGKEYFWSAWSATKKVSVK